MERPYASGKKTNNIKRVRAGLLIVPDRDHPGQELKNKPTAISEKCDKSNVEADRENLEAQVSRIQMSINNHPAFEFPPACRCDIKFIAAEKLGPVRIWPTRIPKNTKDRTGSN